MARVPILQTRVSPRVAADPGIEIPDQSAYLGGVAEAADGLRQRIGRISLAEQREKENSAKTRLATDLNQFLIEAKQDEDPESLPGRFDAFLKEKVDTYSQNLRPDFAEQFKQTAALAGQDYQVKVGNISADARSDRLLANANADLRQITDAFATSDDPQVRDQLAVSGITTLDNLLANGVIDRVAHDKLSNAFAADSLNGLAGRILAQDPRALLDIDAQEEFAGMDQSDRLKWQAAARTRVERAEREAEQERKTREREYLAGFDATVQAMGRGAPLTESAIARVSDKMIDASIGNPDLREALKDQRDIAVAMHRDVTDIPSMTPEAMMARRQEVAAELEAPVSTPESMAVFGIQQDRLANIDKAIQQVMVARERDGAGTARATSTVVQGAFDAFQQEPSPENFSAYKAALTQAYDDQGFLPSQRSLLPTSSAQSMVDAINTEAASNPETAAQLIADLSVASGEDWSRVQSELQAAGLSEDMAAVGFLTGSPRLQNTVVGIAQSGGMKALKEQVPKADRDSIDDEIATAFEQPFRLAGGRNTAFMRSMAQSAKLLAYGMVTEGKSPGDAVSDAVAAVVAQNFQPVEEPRIRGLVDAGVTIDPRVIGAGASAWFETTLAAPEQAPAIAGNPVVVEDNGKFYAVPTVIDGNTVQPVAAEHQARMNRFAGLPSFGSKAEAEAALQGKPGKASTFAIDPVQANAFRINTGMRDADVQDIARMVLRNSGRFEISPDGISAVLVEDAPGTAQAIRDPQGNPITVPISVLEKLGRERLGRIEREKNMGGSIQPDAEGPDDGDILVR